MANIPCIKQYAKQCFINILDLLFPGELKQDDHNFHRNYLSPFFLIIAMPVCLSCLLYKHVAMDGFSSALGSQGTLSSRSGRKRRQARVRRPTPDHPEMAALNGRQVESLYLHTDQHTV